MLALPSKYNQNGTIYFYPHCYNLVQATTVHMDIAMTFQLGIVCSCPVQTSET
jgi:hypothetical protein